jgi:hypothetical protein
MSLRRQIERRAKRRFHGMRERWKKRNAEGQKVVASVVDVFTALEDDRLRDGVIELAAVSYLDAKEESHTRECFGCRRHWTLQRSVVGILTVEHVGNPRQPAEEMLIAGLCWDCAQNTEIIMQGLKRDFGAGFVVSPSAHGLSS